MLKRKLYDLLGIGWEKVDSEVRTEVIRETEAGLIKETRTWIKKRHIETGEEKWQTKRADSAYKKWIEWNGGGSKVLDKSSRGRTHGRI